MSALLGLRYAEDEPPGRRFLPGPEDQDPYTGFSDVKREVFGDDISSPSQQVPAEYYEKGYQVEPVAEEDAADVVVCGCLPPLAVGYAVCVFTLIEGTVLLLHAAQVIDPNKGLFSSLYDGHNPFASTEKGFLWIASVTDLAAVIVGVVGLYLAVHVAPDSVRRGMAKGTAGNLPMVLLGSLLLWRVLITVATAPFVGVMLAFSNPETDRTPYIAGTMAFTLVNVILIYGLAQVFRAAALASDFVAERTEEINAEERRMFLQSAYSNHMELIEEEPRLFGCLPLELALGLWTLLLTVACVVWFIQLCAAGITVPTQFS